MILPIATRILIKPIIMHAETKTEGGIIIANIVKPTQNKGEVLAIGPDVTLVKKGDIVYYTKHAGLEILNNNEMHLIINEGDILAIIKDDHVSQE
jgi:chaperonin GroES